jgi:carbonic anhydrase/acetyltransferase-like protein (isoleucine patch superfamily)
MILAHRGILPKIHPTAFVEATAQVIGAVVLPAKVRRSVTPEDLELIRRSAENYVRLRAAYKSAGGS